MSFSRRELIKMSAACAMGGAARTAQGRTSASRGNAGLPKAAVPVHLIA